MSHYEIGIETLSIEKAIHIIKNKVPVKLSDAAQKRVNASRKFLDEKMQKVTAPVYGINTGFGSLCNTVINDSQLGILQENLVMSHACGSGELVPDFIVKLMLLLKAEGLSKGYSSVQLSTIDRLVDFLNKDVTPVVYTQGSLGASGDLAPLAHLCLPLINEGEVFFNQKIQKASEVNALNNWLPLHLQSKEGLALLNGTQFMSSYAVYCCSLAEQLCEWADCLAALSLDAFLGRYEPFDQLLHQIRPHEGQQITAQRVLSWLSGSEIGKLTKEQVQDPYSFRCVPQVHGASRDTLKHVVNVTETEINAVTDNPTVFADEDKVISGGNFHGQPLALVLDFLAIAVAELANISERRTYQLISGQRSLPPFLVKNAGLNSGFMIPQYTAASIVSQSKQLCTPASSDSIVSSNGQEDHVSMGANAATKAYKVLHNTATVLGIELLNAMQAIDFRSNLKSGHAIEKLRKEFRTKVNFLDNDRVLYKDIDLARNFILEHHPLKWNN